MGKKSRRQRPAKLAKSQRAASEERQEPPIDPREEADRSKDAFLCLSKDSTKKLDPQRIFALLNYSTTLIDELAEGKHDFVTKEDRKFVRTLVKAPDELFFVRAQASFIMGVICMESLSEDSFQYLQLAIKFCDTAT